MSRVELCEICQECPSTSNTFGIKICNKYSCNEEVVHEARRRRGAEERKIAQEMKDDRVDDAEEVRRFVLGAGRNFGVGIGRIKSEQPHRHP